MITNNNIYKIVFSSSIIFLSGCFGSNISVVKEYRVTPEYKIGQILDKRPVCSNIKWRDFKDDRDRSIVEYVCVHEYATKSVRELINEEIKSEEDEPNRLKKIDEKYLSYDQRNIDEIKKSLNEVVAANGSYEEIDSLKRRLSSAEAEYNEKKEEQERRWPDFQSSHEKRLALFKKRSSNFKEVQEVFQWTIQNKDAVFISSKIKVIFSDDVREWGVGMNEMLNIALNDSKEINRGYMHALNEMVDAYGK